MKQLSAVKYIFYFEKRKLLFKNLMQAFMFLILTQCGKKCIITELQNFQFFFCWPQRKLFDLFPDGGIV